VNDLRLTRVPSVKVGMLIRKPPGEVFRALVDPAITTRFWFTKSSGRLVPGESVRWELEMFGVSDIVSVGEIEEDSRILFDWGDGDDATTVEFRFVPSGGGTYVQVAEWGCAATETG
jgi:uncharacterized protein YndB with AHSA1/START domain